MADDVRIRHSQSLDESHYGHPVVVSTHRTGHRGRPQIVFDPEFLAWSYNHRSISALARFLQVGRTTLRCALVNHGIINQQPPQHSHSYQTSNSGPDPNLDSHPLPPHSISVSTGPSGTEEDQSSTEQDDILEPLLEPISHLPADVYDVSSQIPIYPNHSEVSDSDLDDLIIRLRHHYRRAGISMLDGMLRRLGHHVPRERIRQALLRIDPVRRVFERIRIRRRTYSVAGPNALWHHDGQHGTVFLPQLSSD